MQLAITLGGDFAGIITHEQLSYVRNCMEVIVRGRGDGRGQLSFAGVTRRLLMFEGKLS